MSTTEYGKPITMRFDEADLEVIYRALLKQTAEVSVQAQINRDLLVELRALRSLVDRFEDART